MDANRLNRLWRLAATASGFALFGIFGILFKILLLPYTMRPTDGDLRRQKQARRLVAASWYAFSRWLTFMGIVEARFHGFERLGQAGQMIVCNHPSLLDVVFVLGRVPEANCLVRQDLLRNPAMNSQIRACGYLPNSENTALLETVDTVLQNECLLVFPEGTRTSWDGEVKFHRGAVSMALRSAREIVPVCIKMQPPNFKKGQPWYHIPATKPVYEFTVGDPIDPRDWLAQKPLPVAARRLNSHLQNYFNERTRHV